MRFARHRATRTITLTPLMNVTHADGLKQTDGRTDRQGGAHVVNHTDNTARFTTSVVAFCYHSNIGHIQHVHRHAMSAYTTHRGPLSRQCEIHLHFPDGSWLSSVALGLLNVTHIMPVLVLLSVVGVRGVYPPNTLEQVPSPLPSPFPPLRSRPLIAARGLGERFCSPAGPGGARTPNGIW